MNKAAPTAILFDLDGTLIDRRASIARYAELFCRDFNDELLLRDKQQVTQLLIAADGHGYRAADRPVEISAQLLAKSSPNDADRHWRAHFPKLAVLAEDALEVLSRLADEGIRMGLVTNGSVYAQTTKLDKLDLARCFEVISISEAYGFKKPDPRIFTATLAKLACPAVDAWFVGDHAINDVQGAEAVGMRGFLLPGIGWPTGSTPCGSEIETLQALLEIAGLETGK